MLAITAYMSKEYDMPTLVYDRDYMSEWHHVQPIKLYQPNVRFVLIVINQTGCEDINSTKIDFIVCLSRYYKITWIS